MPSVSKPQQHLMGMAWAVRKGKLDRSKVSQEVITLADGKMSDKDLQDFAKTKHTGLKEAKDYNHEYLHKVINGAVKSLDIDISKYDMEQIHIGMNVELEHGSLLGDLTNITGDNADATLQIVLAHLKENPKYYTDPMPKDWGKNESATVTPSSITGAGAIELPGDPGLTTQFSTQPTGSGDIPIPGARITKEMKKKKRKRIIMEYDDFTNFTEDATRSKAYHNAMKHMLPFSEFVSKEASSNDDEFNRYFATQIER